MSDITERIVRRANQLNLKQSDIASYTGASKATVHKWFNHINEPSSKFIDKLAEQLEIDVNFLMTGKGNIQNFKGNIETVKVKLRRIPLINWVQAGEFNVCDDINDEWEYIVDNGNLGDCIYALIVRGDSMQPSFNEGDYIIIDQKKKPKAGDYVIAMVQHENVATFKRFKPCGLDSKTNKEYWQLVPLNDFYPTIDSRVTGFSVRGVVIRHIRHLVCS